MFKKIFCLALALVMIMSIAAVGFSAAQVEEIAEVAADADAATTGADDENVATTGAGSISFDAASAGWSGTSYVSFYIYELGGSNVTEWGGKNKSLTSHDGDIWSFDAAGAGVQDGKEYGIIFENLDSTAQTADLLFNSSCFGDTAYVPNPDDKLENAVDSNKKSMKAAWKNSSLGSIKQITSLGNIVGDTIPGNTSAYQMMVNFLASKGSQSLTNALNFNGKDAQTTIDETAAALDLTKADVTKAIKEAAETGANDGTGDKTDWSDKWDASKSPLPAGGSGSDDNKTTETTSGSNNNTTTSNNTSTSSTSTTKSGSASNTQTGQEENILFIMLGVMVVAAGVIFFTRKRERA